MIFSNGDSSVSIAVDSIYDASERQTLVVKVVPLRSRTSVFL